jgi:uncharacterized lipoprotein YddW (UPF0748 family)
MHKLLPLLLVLWPAFVQVLEAQSQITAPKREFRGVWIATVSNIDFPSSSGLSTDKFKEEWTARVKAFQALGFNALVVQIRPAGDAFYNSKIAPWSKFLSGQPGLPLAEDFDPLRFMIETAHNNNLDFHAWLNPFRASLDTNTMNLAPTHPFRFHPEWFVKYGGRLYFNPALPEVRNYITEVIMELLTEYPVDGIHFDDYFYPYPAGNEAFPDSAEFMNYGFGFQSIAAWRRNNVDKLISQVASLKKSLAPEVKFGISPFGVWRNKTQDAQLGSDSKASVTAYDNLYADVRNWLEKGWIDYVAPQLYWHIGYDVADYEKLLNWWANNTFGRHLIIGQASYRVNSGNEPVWKQAAQLPRQLRLNRNTPQVNGSIFFNATSVLRNELGVTDSIKQKFYVSKAIWPEIPYLEIPASMPPKLEAPTFKNGILSFQCKIKNDDVHAKYVVVYRFNDRLPGDYQNPVNIFGIYRTGKTNSLLIQDTTVEKGNNYTYVASTVNAQYTESNLSNFKAVNVGAKRLKRLK